MLSDYKKFIEEFLYKYPGFILDNTIDEYVLTGMYILHAEFDDVPLYDEYKIEIRLSKNQWPFFPLIKMLEHKTPDGFYHNYDSGYICVAASCEIIDFNIHHTLVEYMDHFVQSYFYSLTYYRKYNMLPYGERAHGVEGILEAYCDRYCTDNAKVIIEILKCLSGEKMYRGHNPCPCMSGKKFRNCHGEKLLKDIKSPIAIHLAKDAKTILNRIRKDGNIY